MNSIGTQRQRAVIAAFKVKPEATYKEIAAAAAVSLQYAELIVRDYLSSKANGRALACQVPARRASMAVSKDVAVFHQPDRSVDPLRERVGNTAKQQEVNAALAEHPRMDAESLRKYSTRIGAIAGVSAGYVIHNLQVRECSRIGAERRAKEAQEAKTRCEVIPAGANLGPVRNFRGWVDTFAKFKMLADAYLALALERGDVFAAAFLRDIQERAERAQTRAGLER